MQSIRAPLIPRSHDRYFGRAIDQLTQTSYLLSCCTLEQYRLYAISLPLTHNITAKEGLRLVVVKFEYNILDIVMVVLASAHAPELVRRFAQETAGAQA